MGKKPLAKMASKQIRTEISETVGGSTGFSHFGRVGGGGKKEEEGRDNHILMKEQGSSRLGRILGREPARGSGKKSHLAKLYQV